MLDANSPAKLYDALAVGTPVVVTNNGWTRALVEREGCGWYVPAGDAVALARRLHANCWRNRPRCGQPVSAGDRLAAAEFDRQQIAAVVQQVLESAAQAR